MDDKGLEQERRKQARLEKLGTNTPRCCVCGETDWRCLELHHVADLGRDETTVIICANHHRIVTDDQKDHPPINPTADPMLDRIGNFLLGLADMLKLIVARLYEFGNYLIARAALDQDGEAVS